MTARKNGPAFIADATAGSFITFTSPRTGETVSGMVRSYARFDNGRGSMAVEFTMTRDPHPYRVSATFHITIL